MQQIKVFIDLKISSTCFGQNYVHHQERKTANYSMWYGVLQRWIYSRYVVFILYAL
jgi:hypothetical protein